jgi:hypothetical protein
MAQVHGAGWQVMASGNGQGQFDLLTLTAQFDTQPPFIQRAQVYVGLAVAPSSTFGSINLTECDAAHSSTVWIYLPGPRSWAGVANATRDPSSGCLELTIDETSLPQFSQLGQALLAFGDRLPPPPAPRPTATLHTNDGRPYVPDTWTNQDVHVDLVAGTAGYGLAPGGSLRYQVVPEGTNPAASLRPSSTARAPESPSRPRASDRSCLRRSIATVTPPMDFPYRCASTVSDRPLSSPVTPAAIRSTDSLAAVHARRSSRTIRTSIEHV